MSQNKTVIQGLEPDDNKRGGYYNPAGGNFYSRSTSVNRQPTRGTVVPGMEVPPTQPKQPINNPIPQPQPRVQKQRPASSGKPILGFLYSISRTLAGEYWALQQGKNSLGQSPESDVILSEITVSSTHAFLTIQQNSSTGQIKAYIRDAESTNGTKLNGDTIFLDTVQCNTGDIISIGNYDLLFILIDAASAGLSLSKDFVSVPIVVEEEEDVIPDTILINGGPTRPVDPSPSYKPTNPTGYDNQSQGSGGTVGLDGTGIKRGGTVTL